MAYQLFSEIYDEVMEDIPYEAWSKYLISLLKEQGIDDGLLLELGCGTGTMTELLQKAGYDMTGIDLSDEMLEKAIEKRDQSNLPILYLQQDMRSFELYGTMRAIVSVCDSMNYLLSEKDFIKTLKLVNNYLDPKGVFIFDLKTTYFYSRILKSQVKTYDEDGLFYVWENHFSEKTKKNHYLINFFQEEEDGRYSRIEEEQIQRAYTLTDIKRFAKLADMEFVACYDAFTHDAPRKNSQRIYVILRERGKENE